MVDIIILNNGILRHNLLIAFEDPNKPFSSPTSLSLVYVFIVKSIKELIFSIHGGLLRKGLVLLPVRRRNSLPYLCCLTRKAVANEAFLLRAPEQEVGGHPRATQIRDFEDLIPAEKSR